MPAQYHFVRLIDEADPSKGAVWRDEERGYESVLAAPKRFRPKCAAQVDGKPCIFPSRHGSRFCKRHQSATS